MKKRKRRRNQWIRLFGLIAALIVVCIAIGLQKRSQKPSNSFESPSPSYEPTPTIMIDTFIPTKEIISKEAVVDQWIAQLSLEEKIGQLFFARCPEQKETALEDLKQYCFGGYILFANHFKEETPDSIREILASYQETSKIPLLLGVDEEGGTVNRVSKFSAFRSKPFASPRQLYQQGQMEAIKSDTKEKSNFLLSLGLNVNLAPVCDIAKEPSNYMYPRSFGQTAKETADYVKEVVTIMKSQTIGSVLKHFPGYGNNINTHDSIAIDVREYEVFQTQDFLPFEAGIEAGADAILVSHTIVECMDDKKPASLSEKVHQILREELEFDGVIMTDDLIMQAIIDYTESKTAAVDAIKAGNDLLIATDYKTQYEAVLDAVKSKELSIKQIEASVRRILLWKMQLGLIAAEGS